jgi:two-component system, cell cycle response regulator DivK
MPPHPSAAAPPRARSQTARSIGPVVTFAAPAEGKGSHPLILVAEDHPDSRDALQTLLEVHGYRVHTAADGREAVSSAITTAPDLILMDIMMPVMDGFEATRELRAREEFRSVPIIALTAMEGARELVLAAGCDDYLPKPIDIRTFLDRIRSWLSSGRTAS